MTQDDRQQLAQRLRWLAEEWRQSPNELRRKIEQAFDDGLNHHPHPSQAELQEFLEQA